MKKNLIIKILVIVLPVLFVSIYFASPLLPLAGRSIYARWEAFSNREPTVTVKEMQKYYENLPKPQLTPAQVIAAMKKGEDKWFDEQLRKTIEWYVYHGDTEVIRQLIANLPYETRIHLPKRDKYIGFMGWGSSYLILKNTWDYELETSEVSKFPPTKGGLLKHIAPVLHEEFHRYAASKTPDPNMLFLLMQLIEYNEPQLSRPRPSDYKDVPWPSPPYFNTEWYTKESILKDVWAYLSVYKNYREFPNLQDTALQRLLYYPGNTLNDFKVMKEIIELTEAKDIETAYTLFLDRYEEKSQKEPLDTATINDLNGQYVYLKPIHIKKIFKTFATDVDSGKITYLNLNSRQMWWSKHNDKSGYVYSTEPDSLKVSWEFAPINYSTFEELEEKKLRISFCEMKIQRGGSAVCVKDSHMLLARHEDEESVIYILKFNQIKPNKVFVEYIVIEN